MLTPRNSLSRPVSVNKKIVGSVMKKSATKKGVKKTVLSVNRVRSTKQRNEKAKKGSLNGSESVAHYNAILIEELKSDFKFVAEQVMGLHDVIRQEVRQVRDDLGARIDNVESVLTYHSKLLEENKAEHEQMRAENKAEHQQMKSENAAEHAQIRAEFMTALENLRAENKAEHERMMLENTAEHERIESKLDSLIVVVSRHETVIEEIQSAVI